MKKLISLIVFLWTICNVFAQDFTIYFQPKVSGIQIDSIGATNLRTNQIAKLLGSESLLLVKTPTSINPLQRNLEVGYIYPNPCDEVATFCFSTNKGQDIEIRLYNANGQLLNQKIQNLAQGSHRFELKFPGAGIYFVSLLKSNESASFKAVYAGKTMQNSSIGYAGSERLNSQKPDANQLKNATSDKTLTYSEGDFIQYSVSSGVNTTIITETPTVSKTFDVEFVNCIDKDNRSYKIVKIGDRWWMAENLAYLPTVSPCYTVSATAPYYYVWGYFGTDVAAAKLAANYSTYGVLYNWPAAKAACPPGWRLPTDDEWKQLEMALGMTQAQTDVRGDRGTDQAMQMKNTSGWYNNGNGTNTSGFAALPGSDRYGVNILGTIGISGFWWSSTGFNTLNAWCREINYLNGTVGRFDDRKDDGLSVRGVKDFEPSSFTDPRDSKTYKTIKIGNQEWMTENLAYLPAVSPPSSGSVIAPFYYVYDYNGTDVAAAKLTANYSTYGVLYNFRAALEASPPGWHLPSDAEWKQLEMYLGMTQTEADEVDFRGTNQGTQMKATSGWNQNGNGTNSSGFAALPAGRRNDNSTFYHVGNIGYWWSSSWYDTYYAWSRSIYHYSNVSRDQRYMEYGFSVRCVRD